MNACNSCGTIVEDDAAFDATGGLCHLCNSDLRVPESSQTKQHDRAGGEP